MLFHNARTLTAIVAIALATPLFAQQGSDADQQAEKQALGRSGEPVADSAATAATYVTAEQIGDAAIVTLDAQYDEGIWDEGKPFNAILADLSEIGTVEDVVMDQSGQIVGLTTDVGGFLGIGENTVLLPLEDIRLVRTEEDDNELSIVTRLSRTQLEELPEFELEDD